MSTSSTTPTVTTRANKTNKYVSVLLSKAKSLKKTCICFEFLTLKHFLKVKELMQSRIVGSKQGRIQREGG